ncbi:RlpA-like double-psi beta-barrel-protein domain-containing protein-containing protein [Xylaria cubensis]|nr:RlpA-like double-psi beta-barrel-protein domain-containing protein-containing protein [Xylaria cubensis]
MKSMSTAAVAALLAGLTAAQPHGHHGHQHLHPKRDLVTEWETVWETVTPTTSSVQAPPAPVSTESSNAPVSGSSYAGADAFGTSSMDTAKYSGDITYYDLGLGACGYDDSGVGTTKHIVAISHADWYNRGSGTSLGIDMPNHPWCDQTITIQAGGKSTTALVHDICPGCAAGSIDVSSSTFDALFGSLDGGRESATWSFDNA